MASLAAWQALGQGQRALGYPPTYGRINPPFTGGYDELGLAHQALVRWADRAKLNHAFGSPPSPCECGHNADTHLQHFHNQTLAEALRVGSQTENLHQQN